MNVHQSISLFNDGLRLFQKVYAQEVYSLRSEQNLDSAIGLVMPLIVQRYIFCQAFFSHGVVEFIKFARLIYFLFSGSHQLSYVSAGAYFIYKSAGFVHIMPIIAQRSGSALYSLQKGHSASRYSVFMSHGIFKRLKTEHHPVVGILSKSSQYGVPRMHMTVDKSRNDCMMSEV